MKSCLTEWGVMKTSIIAPKVDLVPGIAKSMGL
jgi:hypothetical protein